MLTVLVILYIGALGTTIAAFAKKCPVEVPVLILSIAGLLTVLPK